MAAKLVKKKGEKVKLQKQLEKFEDMTLSQFKKSEAMEVKMKKDRAKLKAQNK